MKPINIALSIIPIVFICTVVILALLKPPYVTNINHSINWSVLYMYAFTISLSGAIITLIR